MYFGLVRKAYFHPWSRIIDYGITGVHVGNDGNTYWVYFSSRRLAIREKGYWFLRKTRKDQDNIAFFQYNADVLKEVLPMMPTEIADSLRKEEALLVEKMNKAEKRYHK